VRGPRVEAPKGKWCGEGVSPSPQGEGSGEGAVLQGARATNLLGVINKTVQIPMVGLNIESIVSFPRNTLQTGEGVIGAVIPVIIVSWIHCFSRKSQC